MLYNFSATFPQQLTDTFISCSLSPQHLHCTDILLQLVLQQIILSAQCEAQTSD